MKPTHSLPSRLATTLLRALPAETAHKTAIRALKLGLGPRLTFDDPVLHTDIAGLSLPNPIGLAAGFDKDGEVCTPMLRAGFGFVEAGSVTPKPQAGNPKPRLFRLSQDKAVINRMGFNNKGLAAFADQLRARDAEAGIVGANLGANKDSEDRTADYITGLTRLWPLADYFTVNISSPNTPGLRGLQDGDALEDLLGRLAEVRQRLSGDSASKPVFLKVAPDLNSLQIEQIVESARNYGISALIVGNTTLARPDDLKSPLKGEKGGLSGAPLMDSSTQILREFNIVSEGRIPLIGVGGISSGADAYRKIRYGASAVQLYSAMVYHGPELAVAIAEDLAARLKADGFSNIKDAVGRG